MNYFGRDRRSKTSETRYFFRDLKTKSNLRYNRHLKFEMHLRQALLKKDQGNRRKRTHNKSMRKFSCGKRFWRVLLLIYPRKKGHISVYHGQLKYFFLKYLIYLGFIHPNSNESI